MYMQIQRTVLLVPSSLNTVEIEWISMLAALPVDLSQQQSLEYSYPVFLFQLVEFPDSTF